MALNHSPKIVTDGLVFAYDMGNSKKSWKGKPTVNILSASGLAADTERSGTSYPFVSTNITTYVLANWSASNNKFSMSFEGKRDYVSGGTGGGGDGYPVMYIYFSDWSWSSSFGISTYTWSYNKLENITMPDPTGKTIYFSVYHMNAGNPGKSYSRNHQIEFNTFATPFVNGTRTSSDMVKDLVGGATINGNLTYNSNGTAYFNGPTSFDYLYATETWSHRPGNSFAYEVWYKHNSDNGYDKIIVGKPGGHTGLMAWSGTQYFRLRDSAGWRDITIGESYNTWYHLVGTYTAGVGSSFYRNGELINSNAFTTALNDYGTTLHIGGNVGWNANYSHNAYIDVVKVYNRALSAAEVKQNFNALRGRYGI